MPTLKLNSPLFNAIMEMNPKSIQYNVETAIQIIPYGPKHFIYGKPQTDGNESNVGIEMYPEAIGNGHCHGDNKPIIKNGYMIINDDENFSDDDLKVTGVKNRILFLESKVRTGENGEVQVYNQDTILLTILKMNKATGMLDQIDPATSKRIAYYSPVPDSQKKKPTDSRFTDDFGKGLDEYIKKKEEKKNIWKLLFGK